MSQSGLGNLKRSWDGDHSELGVVSVAPIAGSSTIQSIKASAAPFGKVSDSRVNSIQGGSKKSPLDISTPSPEKKSTVKDDQRSNSELEHSNDSETQRIKRKLPKSFTGEETSNLKYAFKTAYQLKAEGSKTAFFKSGRNSATSPVNTIFGADNQSLSKMFLSKEQKVVHDRVVNHGKSMFFTGSAGTGKSVVLREIIKGLRSKHASKTDAVAVTASTGIAACNIGGVTLHSFAGCGLAIEPVEALVIKVKKNRKSASRWMRTSVLIIDEISMVDPEFLDKLDKIGQILRKSPKPFGGIQVVMTGDFFQLPPVNKMNSSTKYAFDAQCWAVLVQESICLKQVFRQKDPEFVNMLNEMRFGTLSAKSIQVFQSLTGQSEMEKNSKMPATALFPLRAEVEKANAEHLVKISQPVHLFDSVDGGTLPREMLTKALDNFMAPAKLRLKAGCQVMMIKNKDEMLVNGTIGTVLAFLSKKDFSMAQYAGMSWDEVNPEKMKEEEIYTKVNELYWKAINGTSGAKKEEGGESAMQGKTAHLKGLEEMIQKEEKKEKIARSRSASPEKVEITTKYPVVRFYLGGKSYRIELMEPEVWKNEQPNGEVVASRAQVPLILAWAMSIHKSQGQTIPIVKIDLGRVFEKGQAYVALSRAVSKEGLQVLNFNPHKVMADPRVIRWYRNLPTVE